MRLKMRALKWSAAAMALAVVFARPAFSQDTLTMDTADGYSWKVKDVGSDTSLDPSKTDFTGATTANGWSDANVPEDLNADGLVAENTNYWLRLDGIQIPSAWSKTSYLILTGFNVDDSDITYFNGTVIGSHTGSGDTRKYVISPDLVNYSGNNVLAIYGTNGTGAAGITTSAPTLQPSDGTTGVLVISALNTTKNAPAPNILVTIKDSSGTETDVVTGTDGNYYSFDMTPGSITVEISSYPWIGSIDPSGTQNLTITGGKITTLNLKVNPFVYQVVKAATPITIDGNITGSEWDGAMAMAVDQKKQASTGADKWTGVSDCSGTAKWKWDDNYIYLAAQVEDDTRVNTFVTGDVANWPSLWQGDGFETYIQLDPYDRTRTAYKIDRNYQWTIGVDGDNNIGWKIFRATSSPTDKMPPDIPEVAGNAIAVSTKTGYILEARFPWSGLPDANKSLIPPVTGTQGAIALAINDTDTPDSATRESQLTWNTKTDMWDNPASFTASLWADVPSTSTTTKGDLNADGKVNVQDATVSLRLAVGLVTPTDAQKTAGDVNGDGKLSIQDTTLILQVAVGLKSGF